MNNEKPDYQQKTGLTWTGIILFNVFVIGMFWFMPLVAITFAVCWFLIVITDTLFSVNRNFVKNELTLLLLMISILWLFGLGFFSIVTLVSG